MPKIIWDRDAEADLDEIWGFIANDNVAAANRMIDNIGQKCQLLATQPEMGQLRPELMPKLRCFTVANYVIYYRASEDGIEVARIIHSARDIDALF